ncbi:MAG: Gfo/Idh/MocA family oxidoreductase [Syntrophales bacterium]|jgi:predicted dehydrogenase|nr:Gfo/Idh/MocA family oxidoreductase [Syntrophales bacterium]MDY0044522.1 Gfo/Idh/MocA family oxidoreductase [Syntrophales bacterium]
MRNLKIGVVGIGHLGAYHLQKYAKFENCTISGVVDTDSSRANDAARRHHCECFTDHRQLIGKVDAVSITTPTVDHYPVARDFLDSGIDVLLEKPITATLKEADDLIALAERNKCIFQVGFVERFNPAVIALRETGVRPLFVESHRLHPFFKRGTDVDVILDLMIHDLDIILFFTPSSIKKIDASGISVLSNKIDIANVRLAFESGCVANITASRISSKKMQKIRFFGLDGYHSVDYAARELVSWKIEENSDGKKEIRLNNVPITQVDPLEAEIGAFVESVFTRTLPLVSGKEARKSLDLALQILRKIEEERNSIGVFGTQE